MDSKEGYERRDVRLLPIIGFGLGLAVSIALLCVVTAWLFNRFAVRETALRPLPSPLAASDRRQLPPEPRLEVSPNRQLKELRAREDQVLGSYGWVDRDAGIVRIPVERAIELLAERGLPGRAGEDSDGEGQGP